MILGLTRDRSNPQDHERPTTARFHVPLQGDHAAPLHDHAPCRLSAPSLGYYVHESRGLAARIQRGESFSIHSPFAPTGRDRREREREITTRGLTHDTRHTAYRERIRDVRVALGSRTGVTLAMG